MTNLIKPRVLELFLTLEQMERGEPNIAKTKVSRQNDTDIEAFEQRLAAFIFYAQDRALTSDDKKRLFVLFYKFVEKSYFLGQEYSDKASGTVKTVTKTDLQQIEQQSRDAFRAFLRSLVEKGAVHDPMAQTMIHYDIEQLSQTHDDFDETILQAALNKRRGKEALFGIDWLANLLLLQNIPLPNQLVQTVSITASDVGVKALNQGTISNAEELVWITRVDDKVCPICRPLHRKSWKKGDPNMLIPPEDSHPRCRCRLLLPSDLQ